jgi:C4-type Zn-finger protein
LYHFPPKSNDELGVVLGAANTIEGAIDKLKENLEMMKGESIECNLHGFSELLADIEDAEEHGIEFTTQEIPDPKQVL